MCDRLVKFQTVKHIATSGHIHTAPPAPADIVRNGSDSDSESERFGVARSRVELCSLCGFQKESKQAERHTAYCAAVHSQKTQ